MFEQVIQINISANLVAWYGAVISTFSLFFVYLNFLRDKSAIEVKISQGIPIYGNQLGETIITITAINIGRRPVTLTGAGFELENGRQIVIMEPSGLSFPCDLLEGKSVQTWVDQDGIFKDVIREGTKIRCAWFRTATDKKYKARFKIKMDQH